MKEAIDGEQGLHRAQQLIPDLIICDLMMPKMNGNKLTKILKNDHRTSHIPIITLTAKNENETRMEAWSSGADAFITKPFNARELRIRIKNLIDVRRTLQKELNNAGLELSALDSKILNKVDEKFMGKVLEVIEEHINEEDFSIEEFGHEVGMSRTQVHRKLKALTGKSTSKYILTVGTSINKTSERHPPFPLP